VSLNTKQTNKLPIARLGLLYQSVVEPCFIGLSRNEVLYLKYYSPMWSLGLSK